MDNEIGIHIAVIKGTEKETKSFCKMLRDKYEVDIEYVTLGILVDDMTDNQYRLEISMQEINQETCGKLKNL